MKDVEISIKGLFFYILRRWKSVVVAMLIGAVVLGGFQMVRSINRNRNVAYVEEEGSSLTDSERAYVESVYNCLSEFRSYNEMLNDSIIMSMDSKNIAKTELIYMISVNDSDYMEGIERAYMNYLTGSEFYGYISDKTGLFSNDVIETVSTSYEKSRDTACNTAIKVIIISPDNSGADEIAKAVKSYIVEKSIELINRGYEHELTEIGNSSYQGSDLNIEERQIDYLQEIQSRNQAILGTENSLSDAQKKYYETLSNSSEEEADDNIKTSVDVSVKPSAKYIALGLILGAFIMCGTYFIIYVLSNRLDEDDDIEGVFGTFLIGTITGGDYGKTIYKLQHLGKRTFDFDESVRLISTKIKMVIHKDGVSKLGIIGCGISKNNEKAANDIIAALKKDGIEAVLIDDPIYDPASAEKLSGVERAVLLEKVGVTYRAEIWKELEMIKALGIKTEGIIIAE